MFSSEKFSSEAGDYRMSLKVWGPLIEKTNPHADLAMRLNLDIDLGCNRALLDARRGGGEIDDVGADERASLGWNRENIKITKETFLNAGSRISMADVKGIPTKGCAAARRRSGPRPGTAARREGAR